jgi:hypothetical protein
MPKPSLVKLSAGTFLFTIAVAIVAWSVHSVVALLIVGGPRWAVGALVALWLVITLSAWRAE